MRASSKISIVREWVSVELAKSMFESKGKIGKEGPVKFSAFRIWKYD
jgi:hypothetical protein